MRGGEGFCAFFLFFFCMFLRLGCGGSGVGGFVRFCAAFVGICMCAFYGWVGVFYAVLAYFCGCL